MKKSLNTSQLLLTNHIKALSQADESKCLHEEKLSHPPGLTLSWKKADLTTQGKCEMCHINTRRQGKVK